jgi:hypothetical protein
VTSLGYDNPNACCKSQDKASSSSDQKEKEITSGLLLAKKEVSEIPAEEGWKNGAKYFASSNLQHSKGGRPIGPDGKYLLTNRKLINLIVERLTQGVLS